jgi:hypothetical protein
VRRKTDKAIEIIAINNKLYWIPLSQISPLDRDIKAGDRDGSVSVTEWFAIEKGWLAE